MNYAPIFCDGRDLSECLSTMGERLASLIREERIKFRTSMKNKTQNFLLVLILAEQEMGLSFAKPVKTLMKILHYLESFLGFYRTLSLRANADKTKIG